MKISGLKPFNYPAKHCGNRHMACCCILMEPLMGESYVFIMRFGVHIHRTLNMRTNNIPPRLNDLSKVAKQLGYPANSDTKRVCECLSRACFSFSLQGAYPICPNGAARCADIPGSLSRDACFHTHGGGTCSSIQTHAESFLVVPRPGLCDWAESYLRFSGTPPKRLLHDNLRHRYPMFKSGGRH
jgi:hypothetical protein